jgi:steroid delta-isomerase-like uncharacterized protein
MSSEQNRELAARMIEEIFNRGNVDKADEFLSPDFAEREVLPPGLPPGREGVKQMALVMRSAFPDFKGTIEDTVAEGDKVVVRWTCTGTHSAAEFMGIPPTGKKVSVEVIDIIRIADGKFVEHWGLMDNAALMQQLGATPEPAQA